MSERGESDRWDVVVVGAGPAGLLAASRTAELGCRTLLIEKNRKVGVKILMSGGTRCNLTHDTDSAGIAKVFGAQGRFLQPALRTLDPRDVVRLFASHGLPTRVESSGKVFPASDRAVDVQRVLLARLLSAGAELATETTVRGVAPVGDLFDVFTDRETYRCRSVLLTAGGKSYPGCGTTGDGYQWLRDLGHVIVPPRPALVPLVVDIAPIRDLSGMTLPDVVARIVHPCDVIDGDPRERLRRIEKRAVATRRGSMLFTHFGLSGPAAMDVSRAVTEVDDLAKIRLVCDLLPDDDWLATTTWLGDRSRRERVVARRVATRIPQRLAIDLCSRAGVGADKPIAELSTSDVRMLAQLIRSFVTPVHGTRGFAKAEVTGRRASPIGDRSKDDAEPPCSSALCSR